MSELDYYKEYNKKSISLFRDKIDSIPGEWQKEPDKVCYLDEETSFPCMILRNTNGALCGYVAVGEQHPLFGKEYNFKINVDDLNRVKLHPEASPVDIFLQIVSENPNNIPIGALFNVHGGITFSWTFDELKLWWFGFDCNHYRDIAPRYAKEMQYPDAQYRNIDYVKNEIKNLAKQLSEWQ